MTEHAVEVLSDDGERSQVGAVRALVDADKAASGAKAVRVRIGDQELELPRPLVEVLAAAAALLDEGNSVAVVGQDTEVSPAEAAKLLRVSRQYVDRLLADGVLPLRRLPSSSYRKIPVRAVLDHRAASKAKRDGIRRIVNEGTTAGVDY